jgi:pilus assembly protein CpaC
VLGALFRSVRYERRETELVVLVTPKLVEAMNPSQVPPLPGESWRHPEEVDLYLNQDIGGEAAAKPTESEMTPPGARGEQRAGDEPSGGETQQQQQATTADRKNAPVKRYHGAYGFTPPTEPAPAPAPAPRDTGGGQ